MDYFKIVKSFGMQESKEQFPQTQPPCNGEALSLSLSEYIYIYRKSGNFCVIQLLLEKFVH